MPGAFVNLFDLCFVNFQEFAIRIINETHECWKKLIMKKVENDQGLAW